jgi:hypothetical protein
MPEYEVWLGMRIEDAENSVDAAEQAQSMIQRPGSNWLYQVTDCETGEKIRIDLDEV